MNVDQRLHRAAHRVRELAVEVPEFVPRRRSTSRRAAPVLAGLLVLGGAASVMTQHAVPTADGVQGVSTAAEVSITQEVSSPDRLRDDGWISGPPTMSVHDEISLIRSLGPDDTADGAPSATTLRVPSGVS